MDPAIKSQGDEMKTGGGPMTKKKPKKQNLPRWDLTHLYKSITDPQIEKDFLSADKQVKAFVKNYKGKLAKSSGNDLGAAIRSYEKITETLHKIGSYSELLFSVKTDDPKIGQFMQTIEERMTTITMPLVFFTLELNKLDNKTLAAKLKSSKALQHYKPFIDGVRDSKPYQLSDEIEELLHEKSVTGRSAWTRLFEQSITDLRFTIGGKKLTETETLNFLSNKDRKKREAAAKELVRVFKENIRLFALITNTLAKDKEIMDRKRGFQSPMASRNISNEVEDEVVNALVKSVTANYANTAHRYYKLKAKWLGLKKMEFWDRNAPLPFQTDATVPWADAKKVVLDSFYSFNNDMGKIAQRFFDEDWIDAPPQAGKRGGAFAHYTVPQVHPYVLMNYQGKVRDVMTLAHELGHGIHGYLGNPHGILMAHTPLTLAETASVFGEMLVFQHMVNTTKDKKLKKAMLASKIEDMLNTVVRQIAFHHYEVGVHEGRKVSELTPDAIGKIWMKTQTEALGPAFNLAPDYANFWAYVPHFLHTPFYVYAYAFGDCIVNSLYAVYEESEPKAFSKKYVELLATGGTKRHRELLKPFGLNAADPKFWNKGIAMITRLIDQVEAL
jgi:oligoendopeptidase F